jgi:ferric-dicitrate binding protein FerR (iron transport regulator)
MSASTSSDLPRDPNGAGADTPIAELLRLAGPRPQPTPSRAAEALAAVEAQWQRTVRRRRLRRSLGRLAVAAVLLLALAGVARLSRRPAAPQPVLATLVGLSDVVRVRPTAGSPASPIRPGDGVTAGATLESGPDGRAAFRLADGTSLRLDRDTRVLLEAASRLTLERGAVYVDSHALATTNANANASMSAGLQIRTSQGIVRDIGTQFEVRTGPSEIRIRVREGDVQIDRPETPASSGGAAVLVTQAEEVRVGARGLIERRQISRHGPEWSWVEAIAPLFSIEGASLDSFLQWVSREEGRTWRYADDAATRHASTVVLHGSIKGLTPAQALDAVLPTYGMTSRLRDGTLVISVARE